MEYLLIYRGRHPVAVHPLSVLTLLNISYHIMLCCDDIIWPFMTHLVISNITYHTMSYHIIITQGATSSSRAPSFRPCSLRSSARVGRSILHKYTPFFFYAINACTNTNILLKTTSKYNRVLFMTRTSHLLSCNYYCIISHIFSYIYSSRLHYSRWYLMT